MEEIILDLIMHSGEARSFAMEAIFLAKKGDFHEAKEFIRKSDEELGYAHNTQTSLIQGEASCQKTEFSLMLVHAEDHLMTTMTFKDIALEIVDLHEKISFIEMQN